MIKNYHNHYGVKRSHKVRSFFTGFAVVLVVSLATTTIFRLTSNQSSDAKSSSLKPAWLSAQAAEQPKLNNDIPWPQYGESAYGVPEKDLYATSKPSEKPVPIASLAKIITALAILEEKPLASGEGGPTISLSQKDVDLFGEYIRKDGVVVPVEVGEQISQHQAMQAMLLVSANNMADTLAAWAFGSVDEYTAYANKMLKEKGIYSTTVADASGFSPNTKSTPEDMTKLGYLYMKNLVLREMTLQKEASIPLAGVIYNANSFANVDNIYGIKIGHTDEAGRTYMAARINKNNEAQEEISVAVVLGADSLATAAQDALAVLKAGSSN